MRSCIVPICNMHSPRNSPDIRSVHKLPVDKRVLEQWYKLIPRGRHPWNENSRICSIHFTEDSFNYRFKIKDKWKRLKSDAVPSLFLGLKSASRKHRQENPEDLRDAQLAKCAWLGHALDKKPVKPSILKPKCAAKVPQEKEQASNETATNAEEGDNASNKPRELECPHCMEVFLKSDSASRRMHCVNDEGKPVSPNSSDVEPILVEYCPMCSTPVAFKPEPLKSSIKSPESNAQQAQTTTPRFACLGCDHKFNSLHLFEGHIEKEHMDAVEKYFFPKYSVPNAVCEMVAKVPGKLRLRRPTCKCDVCGRSFMSIQALRTHQACMHPKTKRVAYKPKIEVIAKRKQLIAKKSMKPATFKIKVAAKMPAAKEARLKTTTKDEGERSVKNAIKTEFECPVCSKMFAVYFSAHKHIQKHHCINDEGMAVSPNSTDLIKPNLIEYCHTCRMRVSEHHTCSADPKEDQSPDSTYTCLGCEQQFSSLCLFEVHIPGVHGNEVDSYFFPDASKFILWKENMEANTNTKFLVLTKKDKHHVHNCGYVTANENTSLFCPSSLIVQEFAKGVQVSFYKQHFGHKCKGYVIPDEFKKFAITSLMKDAECYTITDVDSDDNDLYVQFKKLMENIVVDAAKLNINSLKILLGKALEMTAVLNRYNEDDDSDGFMSHRSMTDEQISDVLEMPQTNKRKLNSNVTSGKKAKKVESDVEPRVTRRIESKATPKPSQKVEPKSTHKVTPKLVQKVAPKIVKSVHSNDSDEEFKNTKNNDAKIDQKTEPKVSPNIEPDDSPKATSKTDETKDTSIESPEENNEDTALTIKETTRSGSRKKLLSTARIEENATPNVSPKPTHLPQSPSSFNDSYKNFVDANFKALNEKVVTRSRGDRGKAVVKTKMGQFKPSVSPNKTPVPKEYIKPVISFDFVLPKVEADLDYEVQERDNDCNILILKI